jgi:hypothetical protein
VFENMENFFQSQHLQFHRQLAEKTR